MQWLEGKEAKQIQKGRKAKSKIKKSKNQKQYSADSQDKNNQKHINDYDILLVKCHWTVHPNWIRSLEVLEMFGV